MVESTDLFNSKEGRSGASFSLFVFLYLIFSIIFSAICMGSGASENARVFLSFLCYAPAVLVAIALKKKNGDKEFRLFRKTSLIFYLLALLLSLGMLLGFGFVNLLFSELLAKLNVNVSSVLLDLTSPLNYFIYLVALAFAPALFEECFFRGVLLEELKGDIIVASLLSALCFSLYHLSLAQLIYQFIYGFFLSTLAVKSKSIIPSIIAHFLNNFMVITTEYLKVQINFFSPLIIVFGLTCIGIFVYFVLLHKKSKEQITSNEKINATHFLVSASAGLLMCVILMILGAVK